MEAGRGLAVCHSMRLVCWNVNGLRAFKGYQPWYQLPSFEACLEELQADIACFQEAKLTRKQLTHGMCILQQYEAFYDLHPTKGYAGTATYVRTDACRPKLAQAGITGYGTGDPLGAAASELRASIDPALFRALDREGRCVVLDCRMFILVNVYAPNETGPERTDYKYARSLTQDGFLPRARGTCSALDRRGPRSHWYVCVSP